MEDDHELADNIRELNERHERGLPEVHENARIAAIVFLETHMSLFEERAAQLGSTIRREQLLFIDEYRCRAAMHWLFAIRYFRQYIAELSDYDERAAVPFLAKAEAMEKECDEAFASYRDSGFPIDELIEEFTADS